MELQKIRYYEFGEFRLDAKRRILNKSGEQISLSGRLFDLLLVMVQSDGRILEHDELLEKVWGETFVEQANLKKGISSLRQILGEKPNESLYIKTIPRRGYSFVAEVAAAPDDSGFFNASEAFSKPAPPVLTPPPHISAPPSADATALEKSDSSESLEKSGEFRAFENAPANAAGQNVRETPLENQTAANTAANTAVAHSAANSAATANSAISGNSSLSAADSTAAPQTFFGKYKYAFFAVFGLLSIAALAFGIRQFWTGSAAAGSFRMEDLKIQKMTTGGNVYEAAISPDGKTFVYSTSGENKQQTLWAKRVGAANPLQVIAPAATEYNAITVSPDNNYIYYVARLADSADYLYRIPLLGGSPHKLSEDLSSGVTFSPDGKKIAFVRDPDNHSRVLITANAEDGSNEQELRKVNDNHLMISPVWSPDGQKIAFVSSQSTDRGRTWSVLEVPAAGGEPREIVAPRKGKIYVFDWARDQKGLIVCADPDDSQQSQIWYAAYPNGALARLTNDILTYQNVNLSADGNSILTIQKERTGDLFYMNYSLLQNTERLTDSQAFMGRFAVASDNRILAESNENGRRGLAFINADGSNFQPLFPNTSNEQSPWITRDGRKILFVSTRSGTAEIWQTDIEGRNPKKLTDEKTFLIEPRPSPDEKYIYFQIYDAIRWRLARIPFEGGAKPEFVFEETIGSYSFSPDGTLIAYSYFDVRGKKWRIAVKKMADNSLVKEFDGAATDFIGWTPDGKNLIYTLPEAPREGGSFWLQPLDGGASKLVLDAKGDKILWADWSPDGQKLYFTKGRTVSNIVLINREKQ